MNQTAQELVQKWTIDEKFLRDQEAKGCRGSAATVLAQCRRELQEAFRLAEKPKGPRRWKAHRMGFDRCEVCGAANIDGAMETECVP